MTRPPNARRSIVWRCALAGVLVLLPIACKSSRTPVTTTTVATTSTTTSTSTSTTTSTTTEPLVVEGGIVKVANASGVDGAARALTAELAALGFVTRDGTNAAGIDADLETSKIYVIAGSEAVAQSVSRVMGGLAIERMPTPAWIKGGTAGLEDATVLVMLGHDRAGTPLADMGD